MQCTWLSVQYTRIMNKPYPNCGLEIVKEFYNSQPFHSLAVLNCIIEGCLPFTSVIGSILLLVAVFKFPQLREVPSNLLLASQAISDLLVGLLVQPYLTVRHVGFLFDKCLFPESVILKGILSYLFHVFPYFSVLNICLITVDRYMCIAYPLRYLTLVTERRVFKAIVTALLLSMSLATVRAVPVLNEATDGLTSAIPCLFLIVTTVVCYSKIARIASRHRRQMKAQLNAGQAGLSGQDFQSSKTTFLMVGMIFMCYIPPFCLLVGLYTNRKLAMLEAIKPFVTTFAFLSSSINPLVYYIRSRKIRHYVWKVLKCD